MKEWKNTNFSGVNKNSWSLVGGLPSSDSQAKPTVHHLWPRPGRHMSYVAKISGRTRGISSSPVQFIYSNLASKCPHYNGKTDLVTFPRTKKWTKLNQSIQVIHFPYWGLFTHLDSHWECQFGQPDCTWGQQDKWECINNQRLNPKLSGVIM